MSRQKWQLLRRPPVGCEGALCRLLRFAKQNHLLELEGNVVIGPASNADFLEIRLERGADDEEERLLRLRAVGPVWSPRYCSSW